jgi:signal transduction histidine kinase
MRMDEFAEVDQRLITSSYRFLEEIFVPLKRYHASGDQAALGQIQSMVDGLEMNEVLNMVRHLGVASLQANPGELLGKTVHDLRGGAMSSLIGLLQLAQMVPLNRLKAHQLFFLTRDHLKIMRNALLGLDDVKRQADLLPAMHGVDLIIEKWQHAVLGNRERQTRLEVESDYSGNIAECCVEFGALDRVLYNLINNACRHTASGEVKLSIHGQPAGCAHPDNLCFCVSNPVGVEEGHQLSERGDLRRLFEPGVSSTGSGLGLTVAADFVTNAYGLRSHGAALDGRYLGARFHRGGFHAWFHWPIAADV